MQKYPPVRILLVEDNPADSRLVRETMCGSKILCEIDCVETGEAALAYLRGRAPYEGTAAPDLVLLDLNLPGKNGHEVLEEIKADDKLLHIPVIILTTSEDAEDIERTYNAHANCYLAKPISLDGFVDLVSRLRDFWLAIVKLPTECGDERHYSSSID